MITVLLMTVFIDLIIAVATGMVMAAMVFMERMADLQMESTTTINLPTEEFPLQADEKAIMEKAEGQILLYHMEGPLNFGAAKGMVRSLSQFNDYKVLLLDLSAVPQVDFTAAMALNDMIRNTLNSDERKAILVGMRPKVEAFLKQQNILKLLDNEFIHTTRSSALEHAALILLK